MKFADPKNDIAFKKINANIYASNSYNGAVFEIIFDKI